MNERLTERVGDGIRYDNGKYIVTCYPKNGNLTPVDKLAAKLCDLEDKIENGAVIVLPCKVGDKVYEINRYDFEGCKHCGENGDVCPNLYAEVGFGYECRNTKYGENPLECSKIEVIKIQDITYIFYRWFDFGKTVFLTKEEAEKALAERSEENA